LYRRTGDIQRAREDFERALVLATNTAERRLIQARLGSL
jgi:predicted RNA polymerase sigma factor